MSTDSPERDPDGSVVGTTVDDHIWHVVVDRAEKRNAFTPVMLSQLAQALTELDDRPELFVGVLSFAGDHSTAGLDMPKVFGSDSPALQSDGLVDPFGLGRRLRKPLITALHGLTYTVGIELALAGDIVVAAADAQLCQIEPRRGLAAFGGATLRYTQRGGWGNGMYHLLRADRFDAQEAYRVGIVQEVVDVGTDTTRALEIARELLGCSPLALQLTIENARLAEQQGHGAAAAAIPAMARTALASADFQEGIASFVERRDAVFTGRPTPNA